MLPRDGGEKNALSALLEKILRQYARSVNNAIDQRNRLSQWNHYVSVYEPAELAEFRKKNSASKRNYDRAQKLAERKHRDFLLAWDFLVRNYLYELANKNRTIGEPRFTDVSRSSSSKHAPGYSPLFERGVG